MRKVRLSLVLLVVCCLSVTLVVQPVTAKYRDAINFEDNQFVDISKVEIFHSYKVISGSDSDSFDGSVLEYQVTSGLMSFFELGARLPVKFYDNGTQGPGDFSVFQRFKFQEQSGAIPASSGGIELIFPTGDEDSNPPIGSNEFNARIFGTLGHTFRRDWIWLANGGVTFYGGNQYDDKWEYNASVRYQPSSRLKVMFEALGESGGIQDESRVFFAPGLGFRAESGFNIMASVPVGLTNDSADFKPTIQFAHEF